MRVVSMVEVDGRLVMEATALVEQYLAKSRECEELAEELGKQIRYGNELERLLSKREDEIEQLRESAQLGCINQYV